MLDKPTDSTRNLVQGEMVQNEQEPAMTNLSKEIKDMMMLLAQKQGSIEPQDASLIMQLRQHIGTGLQKAIFYYCY